MLRKCLPFAAAAVVLVAAACGHGPSEPMPPDMPMEAVAADTLAR